VNDDRVEILEPAAEFLISGTLVSSTGAVSLDIGEDLIAVALPLTPADAGLALHFRGDVAHALVDLRLADVDCRPLALGRRLPAHAARFSNGS